MKVLKQPNSITVVKRRFMQYDKTNDWRFFIILFSLFKHISHCSPQKLGLGLPRGLNNTRLSFFFFKSGSHTKETYTNKTQLRACCVQRRLVCDLQSAYYSSCITELQIITCSEIQKFYFKNTVFEKKYSFSFCLTWLGSHF